MAQTRSDIRTLIRDKISCWPIVSSVPTAGINSSATSVTLSTYTGLEDRALLEVGTEIIQVLAFTAGSGAITSMLRGVKGSTAAAHLITDNYDVYPFWGWTSQAINRAINNAINWLGEGMVWTLVPLVNTLNAGAKEFGLPSGCVYPTGNIVKRIEALDSDGLYKTILGWRHQGDRLFLNFELASALTVRLWVQTKQATLSDDTTVLADDKVIECLSLYVAARLLEELLANRTRFYEYSASLNDRASTPDELQRAAYYFFNQAVILRDQISRPGLSGYAPIQRG